MEVFTHLENQAGAAPHHHREAMQLVFGEADTGSLKHTLDSRYRETTIRKPFLHSIFFFVWSSDVDSITITAALTVVLAARQITVLD